MCEICSKLFSFVDFGQVSADWDDIVLDAVLLFPFKESYWYFFRNTTIVGSKLFNNERF